MTIDEIRQKSPPPVRCVYQNWPCEGACVGGLVCMAFGNPYSFPTASLLAHYLAKVNPSLSPLTANTFAERIIIMNDRGDFDAAWQAAKDAENWRPPL